MSTPREKLMILSCYAQLKQDEQNGIKVTQNGKHIDPFTRTCELSGISSATLTSIIHIFDPAVKNRNEDEEVAEAVAQEVHAKVFKDHRRGNHNPKGTRIPQIQPETTD